MRAQAISSLGVRPPLWREARIGLEAASLVRDPIFRGDGVVDGRGRPVLLIPGLPRGRRLALDDGRLAEARGLPAEPSGHRLERELLRRACCRGSRSGSSGWWQQQGQPAAIVGQSRGGTLAKVLAHAAGRTSCPAWWRSARRRSTRWPCTRWSGSRSRRSAGSARSAPRGSSSARASTATAARRFWEDLAQPLPRGVRLVSVYSKSDGVVDWRSCLDPQRDEARGDQGLALRDGGVASGLARRGGRPRELPRRRGAPPAPGRREQRAPPAARRLAASTERRARRSGRCCTSRSGARRRRRRTTPRIRKVPRAPCSPKRPRSPQE